VIALNLRREITEKVSKVMDSLSEEKKRSSAAGFSDGEYRDQLKQVFERIKHGRNEL
jgi:hypothetical protein